MQDISPFSPEARRLAHRASAALAFTAVEDGAEPAPPPHHEEKPSRISRAVGVLNHIIHSKEIMKRVTSGVMNDGFIHAGNLAYISLLSLFPFFIVAASVASIFGRTEDGMAAVNAFLTTVPHNVAEVLRGPILSVISARTGSGIVWLGLLVALWSTANLIETIRDILRRAYGTAGGLRFWQYRLRAIGLTVASVLLVMLAFSIQVLLTGASEFLVRLLPFMNETMYESILTILNATKLAPLFILFIALYSLFYSLTPSRYRSRRFPKWPGAALTTIWWYGTLILLPWALSHLSGYDMTYGSLAGVMITLIFFFLVGLGVVIGAELNAALAEFPDEDEPDEEDAEA